MVYKIITLLLLSVSTVFAQIEAEESDWIQLFNGKDLKDWYVKIRGYELNDNFGKTFRVENGLMKVSYDQYSDFDSRYGHIFYKDKYSYYLLRIEYRFTGEQAPNGPDWAFKNSGVMVHCQPPGTMKKDQDFPISIEAQFLGGRGTGKRSTCNLCTPGTHVVMDNELITTHCINSTSETFHGEEWVTAEILVLGDSLIRHIVNGDTVLTYEKPQLGGGMVNEFVDSLKVEGKLLEEGYIALQSESHPIEFRKVELLNLKGCKDPQADNYKHYFIKEDNSQCLYSNH